MRACARLLCIAWVCSTFAWPELASAEPEQAAQSLRKVAGILDYIGGDYRGAVAPDGSILDSGEYEEQRSLASQADALAAQAGLGEEVALRLGLRALSRALDERQSPDAIANQCRSLRAALAQRHGVALGPTGVPSRADGARLYAQLGCGTCHGADGSANTDAARALDPQPANFLDPERVLTVSPHRAFFAISFGVEGTAMQGFPQLSEADRWSLAFYVLSLRHVNADLRAGQEAFAASGAALPTSAGQLALLTEEELLAGLAGKVDPPQRAAALAYLRAEAPFDARAAAADARLSVARAALREGVQAYADGDQATARERFVAAYLDGFEPHEAGIAARDPELVREVERGMLELRQAAFGGAPAADVEKLAHQVERLLDQAERKGGDGSTALAGAFAIALREGLEIALLVGALLGLVRKRGRADLAKFVHAGWVLAALLGLVTWWGAGEIVSGLGRELAEGFAALLAAVVLLGVTHWLFGQLSSRSFMTFLSSRLGRLTAGSTRAAGYSVLGLSFIAAYREAFELVLFYKALLLEAGDASARVWTGALAGLAVLVVVVLGLKAVGQRLPLRPFMLLSSVLLSVLAFTLTGKGVRALQEAAWLGVTSLPLPELPWLGIHATAQGLAAQGFVLLLLLGSALWPLVATRRGDAPQPAQ